MLLWAQGRLDALPAFDTQADPEMLLALVDGARDEAAALRPPANRWDGVPTHT